MNNMKMLYYGRTDISECIDVKMVSINLNNVVFLNIRGVDYRCIINGISKSEAVVY